VNTQVPVTVGVIRYQSLSPLVSIVPLTGEPRSDQIQFDERDCPHKSAGGCTTLTVRDAPDEVETVTVASLVIPVRFASADNSNAPLPEPVPELTVTAQLSDDADHDVFDITDTAAEPPDDGSSNEDLSKVRYSPE